MLESQLFLYRQLNKQEAAGSSPVSPNKKSRARRALFINDYFVPYFCHESPYLDVALISPRDGGATAVWNECAQRRFRLHKTSLYFIVGIEKVYVM